MTDHTSTAAVAADNPLSDSVPPEEAPLIVNGVVRHPHVSAGTQVRILSLIDKSGSANVRDLIAGLPQHEEPLSAILALVAAGVLTIAFAEVLDENAILCRVNQDPDADGADATAPVAPASAAVTEISDFPEGIESLGTSPFLTHVVIGDAEHRRAFGRIRLLKRPGIYGLMSSTTIYLGMAEKDVGERIASGRQPIANVEKIFVFTDALGNLTMNDALIAERTLYSRACAMSRLEVVNELPIGGVCDVERFGWIDGFVAQGLLSLRNRGFHFLNGSPRSVLAGPRAEPGRIGPARRYDRMPGGELLELHFDAGLVAHAARQSDDRWILLRGSHVRLEAAPSGNRGIHYSRANWTHSGLIAPAPDGRHLVVQQDLVFPNGSSAGQFCAGGKGRPLSAWKPIGHDGDTGPGSAALAAA